MPSLRSTVTTGGTLLVSSTIALAVMQAPLGSPLFFLIAAIATAAYLLVLQRVWREKQGPRRLFALSMAFALAARAPLLVRPVDAASDMVRYQWDGRVQRLGYNPYLVVPADPSLEATHTDDTRRMPSLRAPTPYPPGAQLFFRAVVTVQDSPRALKLALLACDVLTIFILRRWLVGSGRSEWLTLAYAWNPLVILEIAHSGHIDALGMFWIVLSAWCLTERRTLLASLAFVLAVASKPLPIVLAPLYWGRVRVRDGVAAAGLLALLTLPFLSGGVLPLGGVSYVVANVRFNGPVFRALTSVFPPRGAAAAAVLLGLAMAAWFRWRRDAADPAAWAWPMGVALLSAPVIYPWYLLYFTPFLVVFDTMPLVVWTLTVIPTYVVWSLAARGGRWVVPLALLVAEYALVALSAALVWWGQTGVRPGSDQGLTRVRPPMPETD